MRIHMATSVYAKRVPIDIMSTSAFRSNNNAMIAAKTCKNLHAFE